MNRLDRLIAREMTIGHFVAGTPLVYATPCPAHGHGRGIVNLREFEQRFGVREGVSA